MEKENNKKNEIRIELTPEVASGHYANRAMIAHSPSEFFIDFISLAPNMPQAKVQSRIIMTPENAKQLLFALRENIERYENNFGVIEPKLPKNMSNGEMHNPFKA